MPVLSNGLVMQPGVLRFQEVTFTEIGGILVYTGSISIPAASYLVDVIVHGTALWDNAGAVTMKVGDVALDNGIFTGIDLKATDLLAAEGLAASGVAGSAGGKAGGDLANSQWNRRWLATARVISGIITAAGAGGSAGRTRLTVIYTDPTTPIVATSA